MLSRSGRDLKREKKWQGEGSFAHLQVQLSAVEADGLDGSPCCQQDGASWRLVDSARLHSHKSALHNVHSANAVVSRHLRACMLDSFRPRQSDKMQRCHA